MAEAVVRDGGWTGVERRGRARTRLTPSLAVGAWTALVAAGVLWPSLAGAVGPVAAAGEMLAVVLALHALHEGGHIVAGMLAGLPFRAVTLGLLTLRRERRGAAAGRMRLGVNRSWKRFAGCVEREVDPGPSVRVALTVTALGGPAASLVGGALLLLAPDPWSDVGLVSVLIGLINALPIRALGQASDGMIVRRLWSRRPGDVAWRAQFCGGGGR